MQNCDDVNYLNNAFSLEDRVKIYKDISGVGSILLMQRPCHNGDSIKRLPYNTYNNQGILKAISLVKNECAYQHMGAYSLRTDILNYIYVHNA